MPGCCRDAHRLAFTGCLFPRAGPGAARAGLPDEVHADFASPTAALPRAALVPWSWRHLPCSEAHWHGAAAREPHPRRFAKEDPRCVLNRLPRLAWARRLTRQADPHRRHLRRRRRQRHRRPSSPEPLARRWHHVGVDNKPGAGGICAWACAPADGHAGCCRTARCRSAPSPCRSALRPGQAVHPRGAAGWRRC